MGCSKNLVDSEQLMRRLQACGYEVTHDSENPEGEIAVINTCGFIGDAKQESINMILEFCERKERGELEKLYVMGCLSERYLDELREEIAQVDKFYGKFNWNELIADLEKSYDPAIVNERVLTTPSHYAYLKIAEGCNWHCGYCAIPLIRGKHTSIPMETLEQEARNLAAQGVKELMIIAQDSTYYGIDLYGERRLAELLERLCRIEGIEWIRLHYAYPAAFPEDVIEVMARERKICKYLDIPFQHISDNMLSAMKRRHTKQEAMQLIERLRTRIPDIALRTTLLVGYPGETEEDIKELEAFVKEVKFDRLGVFPYSPEEGTYSAEHLTDDVPDTEKQRRADRIMLIQEQISLDNNLERVGRTMRVIVDSRQGDYYVARSEYDSPEVDQEILIPAHLRQLRRGCFYEARITGAENFDLYGEVIAPSRRK